MNKSPEADRSGDASSDSGLSSARQGAPQDIRGEDEAASAYSRAKRTLFLVGLVAGLAYLLLLLFSGASVSIARRLEAVTQNPWLLVPLYIFAVGLAYEIIGTPLDFYGGFALEHKYSQSTQSFWAWAWDELKGKLVGLVIGLPLIEIVYWLLRDYPQTWWIIASVVFIAFAVVMANVAPVILMLIFYKFKPLEDKELKDRLVRLSEKAGTSVRGVYEMDMSRKTRAANAALVGLGNTRRIVLGDTLLENYDADEIESVLAHELGHHANWDMWKGLIFQSTISTLGFYVAYRAMTLFSVSIGLRGPADIAGFPLLMLTITGVSLFFLPTANAFSRSLERRADRFALALTNNPKAFISAMARLGRQNLSEFDPNPIVEFALFSHPSIGKRIRAAEEMLPEAAIGKASS